MDWYVYIMSNNARTLYTGMTDDLAARIREHKTGAYPNSFTARYTFDRCVYYEILNDQQAAALREKQIKAWRRSKRVDLIEAMNPEWADISPDWANLLALK